MGRRRERRQGTSRRVKIDLFVEEEQQPSPSPPPHSAIDPVNCKTEQDHAHQNSDGHTSPPFNSGVQENPLSLLGQYSDDEAEDSTLPPSKLDDVKVDEKKMDAQVADFIAELETSGLLDAKESTVPDGFQESVREEPSEVVEKLEERPKEKSNTTSLASMIGDVVQKVLAENEAEHCDWKAVLHEESGEYYYWNVVTGATTWDKPEGAVEVATGYSAPPLPSEAYGKEGEYHGLQDNYATADPGYVNSGEAQVQEFTIADQFSTEPVDIATIMQVGETISNRFKVLCGDALLLLPENVRLAIEADVRLSDCRSLAAQGSADGLFWLHADAHMKRLESILASQEAAMVNQAEQKQAVNGSTEIFYQTEDVDMEVDMEIDDSHELPAPPDDWVPPLPPEPETAPVPPPEEPPTSSLTSELTTSEHPLSDSNGDLRASIEQPSGVETSTATSNGSLTSSIAGAKSSAPEGTPLPVSTSSAVLVEAAAAAAKKASKVVRTKKRSTAVPVSAPLKANKKVSSLVNKWIAAKEELHESEDEDEKALYDPEALERKRQREIDDWRREQIASGQALDNANFQPLGPVDWRDRVKRARKEDKAKKSTSTGKQCPNLELLSRDLAPGWKAYWDESSGDVYYGNLATSETTWDRPAA